MPHSIHPLINRSGPTVEILLVFRVVLSVAVVVASIVVDGMAVVYIQNIARVIMCFFVASCQSCTK